MTILTPGPGMESANDWRNARDRAADLFPTYYSQLTRLEARKKDGPPYPISIERINTQIDELLYMMAILPYETSEP